MLALWITLPSVLGAPAPAAAGAPAERAPALLAAPLADGCGGVFYAVGDTDVNEETPDANNGDSNLLSVKSGDGDEQRAWLEFDLTTIPATATIFSAYLHLTVDSAAGSAPRQLTLHTPVDNWDPATLTWNNQFVLGPQHGTYDALALAGGLLSLDVSTLVTRWVNGAQEEFGLALLPEGTNLALVFRSSETANTAQDAPRLVVACALPNPAVPPDGGPGDAAQQADLTRLRSSSVTSLTIEFENGAVRFADFRLPIPAEYQADPVGAAWWFLEDYAGLIRVGDPREGLQLSHRSDDNLHLVFRRRHEGIPLYPAELTVHMQAGFISGLSGRYLTDITLSATPRLTARQADALALAASSPDSTLSGDTLLRFVNLGLLGQADTTTHLAWQVNVADALYGGLWVFVDAHDGRVIQVQYHTYDAFDLNLETALNGGPDPIACYWFLNNDQWFDETGPAASWPDPMPPAPSAQGTNAFNFIRNTDQLFRSNLGRDSYDNNGRRVDMYVHVGNNWQNAQYSAWCAQIEFGENMATQDVVAHEYAHGLVQHTSGLIYENQPGALNESFADIFGFFTDTGDWNIGEGSALGTLRNMQNPSLFSQPDHMLPGLSTDGLGLLTLTPGTAPDCALNDCGFVHTNSGIQNKVAYLLVQGDSFNNFTISGLGIAKARRLFYNMLNNLRLTNSAQFIDARNAALAEAGSLAASGSFGFTSNNVCQVRNAYAAVGLGVGDKDCDGILDTTDTDNDNDGVPDASDNCMFAANPGQQNLDGDSQGDACDPDDDGDGVLDGPDNCPRVANPGQADRNSNGIGNVCDDPDQDGVMDSTDNCRDAANPDQRDLDGDGLGNVCDADRDGDGVANASDNSPDHYNPGQTDSDGDGTGDASDRCPHLASGDNADTDGDGLGNPCDPDDDGDGVLDGDDNCPLVSNSSQIDSDSDGVGMACDPDEWPGYNAGRHLDLQINFHERFIYRVPLPVCPACPGPVFPLELLEHVTIQFPPDANFAARIVDSSGLTLDRSVDTESVGTLKFQPALYSEAGFPPYGPPGVGAAGLGAAGAGDDSSPPHDGVRYYIEIFPGEATSAGGSYTATISVSSAYTRTVFLPVMGR